MHRLLQRQLKKFFPNAEPQSAEWDAFLKAVSEAYTSYDLDYEQLERTLEVSSNELFKSNQQLNELNASLESKVKTRTREYEQLNEELITEIEARKIREEELNKTDKLLTATNNASTVLLVKSSYEEALSDALNSVSQAIGAVEVFLWEKTDNGESDTLFIERIKWKHDNQRLIFNSDTSTANSIDILSSSYFKFYDALIAGQTISADATISTNGNNAFHLTPVHSGGVLWGIIGYIFPTESTGLNSIARSILNNFSSSLSGSLQRRNQELFLFKNRQELVEAQEMAQMGTFEVDMENGRIQFTDNCPSLLGMRKEDVVFDLEFPLLLKKKLLNDDKLVLDEIWQKLQLKEEVNTDIQIQKSKNQISSLNFNIRPVFDKQNTIVKLTGTLQDITERTQNENQIKEYASSLEKINKELDQFAYIVSHDLKAPLRAINNLSVWIEEDLEGKLEGGTKKNFEMLRGRILRLESLINGILQYSRAGRTKNEYQFIDMNVFIPEIVNEIAPPSTFKVNIQEHLPSIWGEKLLLEQIFANLISNAIKYNSSENPEISIKAAESSSQYEFSVTDNGPGIEPEFHDKIFVIFQTLQARDVIESTGVGLAIVKKIIEEQGGHVWVESEKGKGATFKFTIPKIETNPNTIS
ncbi:MAG: sensor histidine kinase [Bacteroidia bacterium]|jgi:signal transduction histidine kinase